MPADSGNIRDLTRQLIEREPVSARVAEPAVAAVHGACERFYAELSRWVGSTGCQALFKRALTGARSEHPVLAAVRIRRDEEPRIDGVAEAVRTDGADATATALEDMLRRLIDLLSRFIGEDMVVNLVNRSTVDPAAEGRNSGRREG